VFSSQKHHEPKDRSFRKTYTPKIKISDHELLNNLDHGGSALFLLPPEEEHPDLVYLYASTDTGGPFNYHNLRNFGVCPVDVNDYPSLKRHVENIEDAKSKTHLKDTAKTASTYLVVNDLIFCYIHKLDHYRIMKAWHFTQRNLNNSSVYEKVKDVTGNAVKPYDAVYDDLGDLSESRRGMREQSMFSAQEEYLRAKEAGYDVDNTGLVINGRLRQREKNPRFTVTKEHPYLT
jgi:hypothetical protein